MFEQWLEYVRVAMGPVVPMGSARSTARGSHEGPEAHKAPGASRLETPCVSMDIHSKLRAEIGVELRAGSARRLLVAHDLRHRDPRVPRISVVVEVGPADNCVSFRLDISADQPPGTYCGVIVDAESDVPQGSFSVRVLEATERS